MLRIFLIGFYCIFYKVDKTTALPEIYLQLIDPNENDNHPRNVRDTTVSLNSRTYNDIELISKALEIIKQEKSGINAVEISKCLSMDVGNTKIKFNCINNLLHEGKTKKIKKPYIYVKLYSKGKLPYNYKHKNDHGFEDIAKSGHDVKRSLHSFFDFSNDYLDISDLLRSYNNYINEDESDKTEKINNIFEFIPDKSTNNYLRTLRNFSEDYLDTNDLRTGTEMVVDNNMNVSEIIPNKNEHNLRNLRHFSQDYFDYKDLLRTNSKLTDETPKSIENNDRKKKLYVFKLTPATKDLRRFSSSAQNDFLNKKILRTVSVESDSSVSSDESVSRDKIEASKEELEILNSKKVKDKKQNRFHVKDKSEKEDTSEGDRSNESDIPIQRPIEIPKKRNKVYYMQGANRVYKVRDGRRRLPHFLPKRYHWNEEDMKNLKNYWFNGPQGKYWGAHKTPY